MLTEKQVEALLAPLDSRRVRQVQGNSHLEAWDVRRHLLRVFGWGGWDFEVVSCDCILERSVWEGEGHKGRHTVAYRVVGRLTIRGVDGEHLARFEDGATGDAVNQPSFGDAHDMAIKTAMSQALKRCAMNLGDRYGLSLYNKGGTEAVVGKSLAHSGATTAEVSEHVAAGELDERTPDAPTVAGSGSERAASPDLAERAAKIAEKTRVTEAKSAAVGADA